MRLIVIIILTFGQTLTAQNNFSFTPVDDIVEKVVVAGSPGQFDIKIELDGIATANFNLIVTNVVLPTTWSYVLCSPEICFAPKTESFNTTFSYDSETTASEYVQMKLLTTAVGGDTIGRLDIALVNLETGDSINYTLTVTSEDESLNIIKENEDIPNLYQSNGCLYLESNGLSQSIEIYDLSGKIVMPYLTFDRLNEIIIPLTDLPNNKILLFVYLDNYRQPIHSVKWMY
tara:strand:+ start:1747 stop:2439 length:693 start_codon:yes stop_codon:yes gene_type:complete